MTHPKPVAVPKRKARASRPNRFRTPPRRRIFKPRRTLLAGLGLTSALLVLFASPTVNGADGGVAISAVLRAAGPAKDALVRVPRGKVELVGTAKVAGGINVGVASFDEVRCTLEVKNALDRPVRDVTVELVLARETPGDGLDPSRAGSGRSDDDEAPDEALGADATPIAGWTFRFTLDLIEAGATRALPCHTALPPPSGSTLPSTFAEVMWLANVVSYRVPGVSLLRALEMVKSPADTDARTAFADYGSGLSDEARARDEGALSNAWLLPEPGRESRSGSAGGRHREAAKKGQATAAEKRRTENSEKRQRTGSQKVLSALPAFSARGASSRGSVFRLPLPPAAGDPAPAVVNEALRTPIGFAFVLTAARRIGGKETLSGLLLAEDRLIEEAPPLPEVVDGGHRAPLGDLLPRSLPAAIHETLVDVAHRNLAAFYLLLHPADAPAAPAAPPAREMGSHAPATAPAEAGASPDANALRNQLGAGAGTGASDENEDAKGPRTVLQAAQRLAEEEELDTPASWLEAAVQRAVPESGLARPRQGPEELVRAMGLRGGSDVMGTLEQALASGETSLRAAAATALAARGDAGVTLLLGALDTEDEARRQPIESALVGLDAAGFEVLARQVRARGVSAEADATATGLLAALGESYAAARRRAVDELLLQAEQADALSSQPMELVAQARRRSPAALSGARERLGRLAAQLYRARSAAGRADARTLLDEIHRLGPVKDPSFRAAWRDALGLEARALGERDLDGALALLAEGEPLPRDPALLTIARSLILIRLDRTLDERDLAAADALLPLARRHGVADGELLPRRRRLRLLRLAWPLLGAGAGLLALVAGSVALVMRRRRTRG